MAEFFRDDHARRSRATNASSISGAAVAKDVPCGSTVAGNPTPNYSLIVRIRQFWDLGGHGCVGQAGQESRIPHLIGEHGGGEPRGGRIVGSGGARAADEMNGFALKLWSASLLHR